MPLITVLWLLGMTQAINLIDGLDGLAAGIVAIAAGVLPVRPEARATSGCSPRRTSARWWRSSPSACASGSCRTTSTRRGSSWATAARCSSADDGGVDEVVGGRRIRASRGSSGQTYFFLAPLVIPLFILGVPILDLVFAVVRRASRRKALDVADKGHLHHRLMNLGHGHRRSVLILWAWTALLSGFVLYPVLTDENPSYLPFGMAAIAIVCTRCSIRACAAAARQRTSSVVTTLPALALGIASWPVACAWIHKLPPAT